MLHHLVGRRHQMQRLPAMSQLAPRLLAAAPALAARTFAPQRIAGGRLVAGEAILARVGQPRFQLLRPLQQRRDLLPLAGILGLEAGDLFLWRHALILRPPCKSA